MITKTVMPIVSQNASTKRLIGTRIEYRIFGVLIYRKVLNTPNAFGIEEYNYFTRF